MNGLFTVNSVMHHSMTILNPFGNELTMAFTEFNKKNSLPLVNIQLIKNT